MYALFAWLINSFRSLTFIGVMVTVAKLIAWPLTLIVGGTLGPWLSTFVIIFSIGAAMTTDQFLRPVWADLGLQAWLSSAQAA